MRSFREFAGNFHRLLATVAILTMTTACAQVVTANPDEVHVNTGSLGDIAPGARQWLGWLEAQDHCAQYGKSPSLFDLKGSVVVYRCVAG